MMLPASFMSHTANVLFPPTSEFRGENPHPSSPSWEQCDGDVPAMTAAAPIHGGGFPRTRGGSVLAPAPRAGTCRGGEGACRAAGPSSPCSLQQEEESSTVILNAIIFNNLLTNNELIVRQGVPRPPSRLVLHAPLTGSGAFMGKGSSILRGRQLRGSHPLNPHRLPRGAAGRDPHTPSEFIGAQHALAPSPGPGGGSCSAGLVWDGQRPVSAALVGAQVRLACQHTPACGWGPWPRC